MTESVTNSDHLKETCRKFCARCVLRHLCFDWQWIRKDEKYIQVYLEERFSLKFSPEEDVPPLSNNCHSCLGMFKTSFMEQCVKEIDSALSKDQYIFEAFQPQYFLPVQLQVFALYSSKYFNKHFSEFANNHDTPDVKEVFKALMDPILSSGLQHQRDPNGPLEISLHINHVSTETTFLQQVMSKIKSTKSFGWKRRKTNEPTYTVANIRSGMANLSDSELSSMCSIDIEPSVVGSVGLTHAPVYVGGRYNKYSRELPQTPWLVGGERKLLSSVQEYIAAPIQEAFHSDTHNFSSSGREDVDVRMLGNGRPFLIELINARQSEMTDMRLAEIREKINKQTNDVSVSSLKVVSKLDCKRLKEGEEEKTKSYSALCCFVHQPNEASLNKLQNLSKLTDVELKQKTPIRVLHRRPLATRSRFVHSIRAESTSDDKRLFKLDLSTQAGTYVKEFVHGDFGRTSPNLGELLNAEVDIINLDVESVNVNWPPK